MRRQDGKAKLEPIEEVVCEVADEFSGAVIEALTVRKGEVSRLRICACPPYQRPFSIVVLL